MNSLLLRSIDPGKVSLTYERRREKCRVMINSSIIKEMTLEEVLDLASDYLYGEYPEYEKPVAYGFHIHKFENRTYVRYTRDLSAFLCR